MDELTREPTVGSERGISSATYSFLQWPRVKPAVRFSCAVSPTEYEDSLEATLFGPSPSLRLEALVVLVKVRAPRSVARQWQALNELREELSSGVAQELLVQLQAEFRPATLLQRIDGEPPRDRYSDPRDLTWRIMACGAVQVREALPRLTKLSRADNIATSLAAEATLETFSGPGVNEALLQCVLGWKYNAYERAGSALVSRDPELLRVALERAESPRDARYMHGLLLARCGSPAGVPLLCETVHNRAIIDGEMFDHMEALATPADLELVRAMIERVRPEQKLRALRVLAAVLARLDSRDE